MIMRCMMVVILLLGTRIQIVAQISWEQVVPGVWKGVVGIPENYSLLKAAGVAPKWDGFSRLPEVTLPTLASEIGGNIQDGKLLCIFLCNQRNNYMVSGLIFKQYINVVKL